MKKNFTLLICIGFMLCIISACLSGCSESSDQPSQKSQSEPKTLITVTKSDSGTKTAADGTKVSPLNELTTESPSGNITAYFWQDDNGWIYYSVFSGKDEIVEISKLGISVSGCDLAYGIEEITSYDRADEIDSEYETALTVSLEKSLRDHCMEREIFLKKQGGSLTLKVRVYDDGFAFRYCDVKAGDGDTVYVTDEHSEINFPKGTVTFAGGYSATYEFEYVERSFDELKSHGGVFNTPLTANVGDKWALISEADVYAGDISYVKSVLETEGGSTSLKWGFGFKRDPFNEVTDDLASPGHIRIDDFTTENGFTTPWRAIVIADDINGLLGTDMIDSLCPEADSQLFKDTDWIRPGKVSWSWWSGGDQHNYDVQVDHVDFSVENGWEYCCLDAGWPVFEDRIEELCDYANKKGVGIILWVNYLHLKTPEEIEKTFAQWEEWGVKGVKTDYFESDDIDVLQVMHNCAEIGAKHHLMIYYHGCINPCGETRTYPNIMSSEAVLGEEFRKWSESPSPKNCLMYPFTRNVVGSMDYTPACIAITKTGESAGFSLAKAVVYESALQHFASSAYAFPSFLGLPLLNKIPCAWDSSTVLEGYPGDYITYLRQSGDDFFIGAMTLDKRTASVSLDFLGDGEYNAYIYSDKDDRALTLETKTVSKGDTLDLSMPDIGGTAVLITKDTIDTEVENAPDSEKEGYTYYECEDGKLSGSASIADSSMCGGGKKVGYVGNGSFNSVELTVKAAENGEYDMIVYCCSSEKRPLDVIVNGEKYSLNDVSSPGFDIPAAVSLSVKLKNGDNTVKLTADSGYAPDLDRIAVCDTKS